MRVHLVDGTYELFRAYFGAPHALGPRGNEVGATRGLVRILLGLLREDGVTHVACAFDHVIESFRNRIFPGYKTAEGVPADLLEQFPLAESAAAALGVTVWSMVEFEADDALATAAARWSGANGVDQIVICTPDKDLSQCVRGARVVCLDRRRRIVLDEGGVIAKFGVPPASIPDWLALVGDSADGIPGIPGWGAKSAASVLARWGHVDAIPDDHSRWQVSVRSAPQLAAALAGRRSEAALYKALATLREDVPLAESLDEIEWQGAPRPELTDLCAEIGDDVSLLGVPRWRHPS